MEIDLGKYVTVLAGRNSTGKSTILGLLANSGELKKKDGTAFGNKQFRAEFSEILKGSRRFDSSKSDRFTIDVINENGEVADYRNFRTAWQTNNGKDRFRVIPVKKMENGKKTESKMPIPVQYLGLSRLFPIGEANAEKIKMKRIAFGDEESKAWFVEKYKDVLSMNNDILNVENYSIGETEKKRGVGIETRSYDYLTNSAGQDNIGQILMALLSFKRLKKTRNVWNGGLLLIDEIDATLHPSAQKRLMNLLIKEARDNNYQIVVTTHSFDLLKVICEKTAHNGGQKNNIELYYFSNASRSLDMMRNPTFSIIENDLNVESIVQNGRKIKVYTEDNENRWFVKNILNTYLPYIELLDVNIGCDSIVNLYCGDVEYFGNVLIVFDGDVEERQLNPIPDIIRKKMNNILLLPGEKRPESVIYEYLLNLDTNHEYWDRCKQLGFNWTYFNENGPKSDQYSGNERERYKKWFNDHTLFFDSTGLFGFWKNDNDELVETFIEQFITSYNQLANRTIAPTIER